MTPTPAGSRDCANRAARASSAGAVVHLVGGSDLVAGVGAETWVLGPWDDWQLGSGLVSGGDLTGDGVGDLLVGAVEGWTGLHTKAGRFYLLAGSSAGLPSDVGGAAAPASSSGPPRLCTTAPAAP